MVPGLVTTIIPVRNRASLLREAVTSVLEQSYRPIEIIIVDDGSTDDTPRVADDLAQSYAEIRTIHRANAGPGVARETGRKVAQGEFIQYLDSDDLLLPSKFETQVRGLREDEAAGVSYGWTRYRHADGRLESEPWKESGIERRTMFPSFLRARWWDTPTPLYRSTVCDQAGPWSDLRLEEDWEYDVRVAALGTTLHYIPVFVAEVRDYGKERLSTGDPTDAERNRQRARAHLMILEHARRVGIEPDASEMKHFARELFLLSRQAGAAGLDRESRALFDAARSASGVRGGSLQFRSYAALATILGWTTLGRISCWTDRFREKAPVGGHFGNHSDGTARIGPRFSDDGSRQ